jgi:hypothetical protein
MKTADGPVQMRARPTGIMVVGAQDHDSSCRLRHTVDAQKAAPEDLEGAAQQRFGHRRGAVPDEPQTGYIRGTGRRRVDQGLDDGRNQEAVRHAMLLDQGEQRRRVGVAREHGVAALA